MRLEDLKQDGFGFYGVHIFDTPPFVMFDGGDCPRARDIRIHKKFEPMSMRLWCERAKHATSIIDIGAQVGVYSLAAATLRQDIRIHAFEPNPFAYARLRLHRQINGMDNIIEYLFGLSSRAQLTHLSWVKKPGQPISSGGQVGSGDPATHESVTATLRRFDSIPIDLGERPLIKIDVEGHEVEAITGFGGLIAKHKPDIILECFDQKKCDVISLILLRYGYKFFFIDEDGMQLSQVQSLVAADQKGQSFNQFLTVHP